METADEKTQQNKIYDQEQEGPFEERSWYESGYNSVRREDTTRKTWERMPYHRFVERVKEMRRRIGH